MKKILMFGMMGILVLLISISLIYLPEYAAKQGDKKYINQYQLYAREDMKDILSTLSLAEKLNVLSYSDDEINNINILSVDTYKELVKSDKNLLTSLDDHLKLLQDLKAIPTISDGRDWKVGFNYATLYNLSLPETSSRVLSVWDLSFYFYEDICICSFLVDANTYQIYEANITGEAVQLYLEEIDIDTMEMNGDAMGWGNYWMTQYGTYLIGSDMEKSYVQAYDNNNGLIYGNPYDFSGVIHVEDVEYNIMSGIEMRGNETMLDENSSTVNIPYTFYFAPRINMYENGVAGSDEGF